MKTDTARWELAFLLETQKQLNLVGRDMDYQEKNRIETLRKFLDSQCEPTEVVQDKCENPL